MRGKYTYWEIYEYKKKKKIIYIFRLNMWTVFHKKKRVDSTKVKQVAKELAEELVPICEKA